MNRFSAIILVNLAVLTGSFEEYAGWTKNNSPHPVLTGFLTMSIFIVLILVCISERKK